MNQAPFILLRVGKGPNYDSSCTDWVNVDQVLVVPGVKYIFGFSERKGPTTQYQMDHMESLATYMMMSKFKDCEIGVYLSAELMVETPWPEVYQALEKVKNWKYLFVRVGYFSGNPAWNTYHNKIRCMKYLMRRWNKETIMDANWDVFYDTYGYEDIPDPAPLPTTTTQSTTIGTTTTTPLTTTTIKSTTPNNDTTTTTPTQPSTTSSSTTVLSTSSSTTAATTTVATTTIITPSETVTLTSHPPATTPNFTLTTHNMTFPTLNPHDGGGRMEVTRWLVVVIVVVVVGKRE